jgi:hypothetical protein
MSALEVADDMLSSIPVNITIEIHELTEFADCKGDTGTSCNGKVHKEANQPAVREIKKIELLLMH